VIGVVAIGRNEGERLRACLASARRDCAAVVYVDSGSTDGSAELAKSLGVHVVDLDLSKPFTAARARNEGFAKLKEIEPNLMPFNSSTATAKSFQGWIAKAKANWKQTPKPPSSAAAAASGFPPPPSTTNSATWSGTHPSASQIACGGDALIRTAAFEASRRL
jgi:glycosyltransferase involved in cell wall biosynthesis